MGSTSERKVKKIGKLKYMEFYLMTLSTDNFPIETCEIYMYVSAKLIISKFMEQRPSFRK